MDSDRGDTGSMCVGILSMDTSRFKCCCLVGQGWGDPCMPCPENNTSESIDMKMEPTIMTCRSLNTQFMSVLRHVCYFVYACY